MKIESIETEINIQDALGDLDLFIETALQKWGEPLRWSITTVVSEASLEENREPNTARIEAIVITE
jgi:hypothetical protein